MTENTIEVGVIGFGKLGLLHSGQTNSLNGVRLKAIADTSKKTLSFLKTKMTGVNVYTDYMDMLNKENNLGAVVIATPSNSHVVMAKECLKRKIPVFIEKPLSATSSEAKELVELLSTNPIPNMVGYMGRYTDTYMKAHEILCREALGSYEFFNSSMYVGQLFRRGKGWRYDKKVSGGGVLITQNAHVIDKLLWFFGELDFISAHTRSLYSKEVEDYSHVFFGFKNGLRGYMDASWSKRHYRKPTISISIQGTNGTLDVNDDQVKLFLVKKTNDYNEGWNIWKKPDLYRGVEFDVGGSHYAEQAKEFFESIRKGSPVKSSILSAFETQRAIEAAYMSADKNGTPIYINEVH